MLRLGESAAPEVLFAAPRDSGVRDEVLLAALGTSTLDIVTLGTEIRKLPIGTQFRECCDALRELERVTLDKVAIRCT